MMSCSDRTKLPAATCFGCAVVLSALSACSGGGGGSGGGAIVATPAPAPVPATPIVTTSGVPISLQAANTSVTYQAASTSANISSNPNVAGSLILPSGQGGTVTLTTDASGNLSKLDFSINTAGKPANAQFTNFSISLTSPNTIQASRLASLLDFVYEYSNSAGYTLSQVAGAQSLSSSAYGVWATDDDLTVVSRAGTFAIGNLTSPSSMPATGSATFTGSTTGVGGATSGNGYYVLQGDAQVIANFGTQSVTTNLTNLKTQDIYNSTATGTLPNLTGTSTLSGNAYAGSIAGTALSGTIKGNFYGTAAQETAGVWQASGSGNAWLGSFGAK